MVITNLPRSVSFQAAKTRASWRVSLSNHRGIRYSGPHQKCRGQESTKSWTALRLQISSCGIVTSSPIRLRRRLNTTQPARPQPGPPERRLGARHLTRGQARNGRPARRDGHEPPVQAPNAGPERQPGTAGRPERPEHGTMALWTATRTGPIQQVPSAVAGHVCPAGQARPGTFPAGADRRDWAGERSLTISSTGNSRVLFTDAGSEILSSRRLAASAPMSVCGTRTVVSAGEKASANRMSLYPVRDISAGHFRPARPSARRHPRAHTDCP